MPSFNRTQNFKQTRTLDTDAYVTHNGTDYLLIPSWRD
jgi:hypothetical protein